MRQIGRISMVAGLWVFLVPSHTIAQSKSDVPDFQEVYDTVRTNLAGLSEAEFNRAAVEALLAAFGQAVSVVTNGARTSTVDTPLISKSSLFEGDIAFIRIDRVGKGLAKAVSENYSQLGTNKLKGLVLDLRYAGGDDYAAATEVADLFLKKERPLLNWGDGVIRSQEKNDAISVPVAVLVNQETAAAAEALAAVLREASVALILGSITAGRATIGREFTLKNGSRLRIATAAVELGDGSPIPLRGIQPDIRVEVPSEAERAYFADAFYVIPKPNLVASAGLSLTNQPAATNRPPRRRFNEAELVRERREELGREAEVTRERDPEFEKPIVHDPALARALDLLKGLAVVRPARS